MCLACRLKQRLFFKNAVFYLLVVSGYIVFTGDRLHPNLAVPDGLDPPVGVLKRGPKVLDAGDHNQNKSVETKADWPTETVKNEPDKKEQPAQPKKADPGTNKAAPASKNNGKILQYVDLQNSWDVDRKVSCYGNVILMGAILLHLKNVTVIKDKATAKAIPGGPESVVNKPEDEVYKLQKGFFNLPCETQNPTVSMVDKGSKNKWVPALESPRKLPDFDRHETKLTIVHEREEHAHIYFNLMEMYDAFFVMKYLKKSLQEMQILILDAKPYTPIDDFWQKAFGKILRLPDLGNRTNFDDMVWAFTRNKSPFLQKTTKKFEYFEEFRSHLLDAMSVQDNHARNCSQLRMLFIWRRNYVAHARNPTGKVSRKIENEDEVMGALQKAYPRHHIQGMQLELLDAHNQLDLSAHTDVLIGMHGAGLSQALFLPPNSAVVELFPSYAKNNWHMENLAVRSGHRYYSWKNANKKLDDVKNQLTKVPPNVVVDLVKKTVDSCK